MRSLDNTEPSRVPILLVHHLQRVTVLGRLHNRVHQLDHDFVLLHVRPSIKSRLPRLVLDLLGPTIIAEGGGTSRAEKGGNMMVTALFANISISHCSCCCVYEPRKRVRNWKGWEKK